MKTQRGDSPKAQSKKDGKARNIPAVKTSGKAEKDKEPHWGAGPRGKKKTPAFDIPGFKAFTYCYRCMRGQSGIQIYR